MPKQEPQGNGAFQSHRYNALPCHLFIGQFLPYQEPGKSAEFLDMIILTNKLINIHLIYMYEEQKSRTPTSGFIHIPEGYIVIAPSNQ